MTVTFKSLLTIDNQKKTRMLKVMCLRFFCQIYAMNAKPTFDSRIRQKLLIISTNCKGHSPYSIVKQLKPFD
jgi:hypothetical protein